jgi:sterol desaturase/sphingolipid hydroxylase (fatty acid hydroxylase superfamily)
MWEQIILHFQTLEQRPLERMVFLVIHTFLALLIVVLSDWCKSAHFGIVYWTGAGVLGSILISFLALDFFGGWAVHITEHKLRFLWRFHIVHHADNNVDVTTGLRHHPVESVLRGLFFSLVFYWRVRLCMP